MLFYLLYCLVIVISASSGEGQILENDEVSHASEERIAGGEETIDYVYVPFQAEISRMGASFCSGVLYNEEYILTAAHCVENAKPEDLMVRVGSEVRGEGMLVPITKIVQHPDYDSPQNNCDIAVLRMTTPLVFTRELQGVYSVDIIDDNFGKELQVTGWGYQNGKNQLSDDLRYVVLPIINNVECNTFYPGRVITKNMICGYSRRTMAKGACVGDGGSPAVIPHRRILLGISSFTAGCGPGMAPSVFTFVQAREIQEFILNNTIMESQSGQRPGTPSGNDDDYDKAEGDNLTNYTYGDSQSIPDEEYDEYDENVNLYDEGSERPSQQLDYGQPENGRPEHEQSGHGRTENEQSAHGRPGHGRPGHGRPGHGRPGHGRPGHGRPGHGRPGQGRPGQGRPGHGRPGHGRPGHGRPGHGRPGHGRPGHGRPGHGRPGHGQSGNEHGQSVHGKSEHERPEKLSELPDRSSGGPKNERSERLLAHIQKLSIRPRRQPPIERPQKRASEEVIE